MSQEWQRGKSLLNKGAQRREKVKPTEVATHGINVSLFTGIKGGNLSDITEDLDG